MLCYFTILKSIGGLALFQVANGAVDIFRHVFMYFCENNFRPNSFWFVILRSIFTMIMFLILGIVILSISNNENKKEND
ncbi:IMV membrane protein [Sheeppox virus]